MRHYNTLQQPG